MPPFVSCAVFAAAEGDVDVVEFLKDEIESLLKRLVYVDVQVSFFQICRLLYRRDGTAPREVNAKFPVFSIFSIVPVPEINVKAK